MEPKVTGLSPMTGPPGTKITVRGENLGQSSKDVIGLTVNGADCLPYLDWKSPKKIITRCAKIIGNGDVIVTTCSGGLGSCDVQFNCYEESVGPTDESAVWVDEIDHPTPVKETFNITTSNLEDQYSVEMASSRFKPPLYLIRNHADANLTDLRKLQESLQLKLANKNDFEAVNSDSNRSALLKSNLPVIMECLNILEKLCKNITLSRDVSIDSIVKSIMEGLDRTHNLFDPLLKQNDIVQSIESAMQVFKRKDGTFFDLPAAISNTSSSSSSSGSSNNINLKNYDSIVKEILNVQSRLKVIVIDPKLRAKIELDVAKKVERLRSSMSQQLHECCTRGERSVDEIKKLIFHLNKLGPEQASFDVWIAMEEMSESLVRKLSQQFKQLIIGSSIEEAKQLSNSNKNNNNLEKFNQQKEAPPVVKFVQSAVEMFDGTYYDILALGQCYFDPKDEFACREELRHDRLAIFNEVMTSHPIHHLCLLLRLALISNLNTDKVDKSLWPDYDEQKDKYMTWLRHALHKDWLRMIINSVIACQMQLSKTSLPATAASLALEDFERLVVELRRHSMGILFKNSTLAIKNLYHQEDWIVEVNDELGSVTRLPHLFETYVVDILKFAKETILKKIKPDEVSILKNVAVQAELKELAYGLINSFHVSLDNALSSSDELPAESSLVLLASKGSARVPTQLSNRILITICNYQFTRNRVFPKLKDEFKRLLEVNVEKVFEECSKKYRDYIDKTMNRFCAIKCKELTSETLDHVKSGSSSSNSKSISKDERSSNESSDLQLNLMITNSQIFLLAPQLVDELLPEIINRMLEERARVRL